MIVLSLSQGDVAVVILECSVSLLGKKTEREGSFRTMREYAGGGGASAWAVLEGSLYVYVSAALMCNGQNSEVQDS